MIALEQWSGKQATTSKCNKAEIRLFPNSSVAKVSTCQCRRCMFHPWVRKIPWRRKWQPTPVFLPGESHGQRSLAGYSPLGCKSRTRLSDFTFTSHFHALEKEMATHSSVLAWRIPGTEEPEGLQSTGSQRVGNAGARKAEMCVLPQTLQFWCCILMKCTEFFSSFLCI